MIRLFEDVCSDFFACLTVCKHWRPQLDLYDKGSDRISDKAKQGV